MTFPNAGLLDAQLDEVKLAFGVVRSVEDFAESEWVKWWGAIEEVSDRRGNKVCVPGKPWKFSDSELPPVREAAYRGEHNGDVLREFGYDAASIAALERGKVVLSNIPATTVSDHIADEPDGSGAVAASATRVT